MPSSFDAAWQASAPAIDRLFGSSFEYQPMMPNSAGGRPVVDPSRPAMIITGALCEKPVFAFPETTRGKGSVVAQEATQDSVIDIAVDALPYEAKNGDRLTQVTLDVTGQVVVASGNSYKVNGPQPDGVARITLRVVKMSSGTA